MDQHSSGVDHELFDHELALGHVPDTRPVLAAPRRRLPRTHPETVRITRQRRSQRQPAGRAPTSTIVPRRRQQPQPTQQPRCPLHATLSPRPSKRCRRRPSETQSQQRRYGRAWPKFKEPAHRSVASSPRSLATHFLRQRTTKIPPESPNRRNANRPVTLRWVHLPHHPAQCPLSLSQHDESRLLKRKEQNRAAQRAFRERKEKHVKDVSLPAAPVSLSLPSSLSAGRQGGRTRGKKRSGGNRKHKLARSPIPPPTGKPRVETSAVHVFGPKAGANVRSSSQFNSAACPLWLLWHAISLSSYARFFADPFKVFRIWFRH